MIGGGGKFSDGGGGGGGKFRDRGGGRLNEGGGGRLNIGGGGGRLGRLGRPFKDGGGGGKFSPVFPLELPPEFKFAYNRALAFFMFSEFPLIYYLD